MKKKIKTKDILAVFKIVSEAKYKKLEDAEKIKVWKITRVLKPVADKFDDDMRSAQEKFRPDTENFDERLKKAQEYERLKNAGEATDGVMSAKEYGNVIQEVNQFNKNVGDAVKEFGEKEVEVEFEPLTEESFGRLMASNDWNMQQVVLAGDFICE